MTLAAHHEAFRRGIDDVHAATDRLQTDKTQIDQRVSAFLQAGWTGLAADSFVEAWDEWKAAADEVRNGLEAMGTLLDATHRDYIAQDDASQASLDSISARIVERLG